MFCERLEQAQEILGRFRVSLNDEKWDQISRESWEFCGLSRLLHFSLANDFSQNNLEKYSSALRTFDDLADEFLEKNHEIMKDIDEAIEGFDFEVGLPQFDDLKNEAVFKLRKTQLNCRERIKSVSRQIKEIMQRSAKNTSDTLPMFAS